MKEIWMVSITKLSVYQIIIICKHKGKEQGSKPQCG